mmetsp:Transcript_11470/g.27395  ORF Transcript_11470/g.27395 Transcript_11470/m.27395 type:complete len:92 (+) Transcript_11470:654-929(+)
MPNPMVEASFSSDFLSENPRVAVARRTGACQRRQAALVIERDVLANIVCCFFGSELQDVAVLYRQQRRDDGGVESRERHGEEKSVCAVILP